MKHYTSIPPFLKLGLLISASLVSHMGYTSHEDDDFPYTLKPPAHMQNAVWDNESPISKPVLASQQQPVRDAGILFSIDYTDSPISLLDDFETLSPVEPPLNKPEKPQVVPPQPSLESSKEPEAKPAAPDVIPRDQVQTAQQVQQPVPEAPKQPVLQNAPQNLVVQNGPQTGVPGAPEANKKILINFNNVGIIEYIRFISRISGKNFVFDENDLQFNVTIISEEPTSIENIMTALIQELRIHDLTLIEQGNNLIIHKNPKVNSVSRVVADDLPGSSDKNVELVTQVFRLNTLDPAKAAGIIRPLISDRALVESLRETNHLIVTDVVSNVNQISELLKSLDSPNSGLVIGQYVARTSDIETLLPLVQQIMLPISQDQPLTFVPHSQANSIFIVSTPFLVERSISILQHLDQEKGKTRIIELKELKFEQGKGAGAPTKPVEAPRPAEPAKPVGPIRETAPRISPALEGGWQYGPSRTEIEEKRARELQQAAEAAARGAGVNILPLFIPVEMPAPKCPPAHFEEHHVPLRPVPLQVGLPEIEEEAEPRVEKLLRPVQTNETIPVPVARQKFYIHNLQYRTGDAILGQIQQIGASMQNVAAYTELLATINTMQWLQAAKALVVTGTPENIDKVRELIEQLDIPLRQVFIEMLILQTTVDDSLHYGVNWGVRFGGGNQAGSMGFQEGASTLQGSLDSTGVTGLGTAIPRTITTPPFNQVLVPDPRNLAKDTGFKLGIMGQHIIHKGLGLEFSSIGALVSAIHDFASVDIVMSPKVITEDGIPAQIFVGVNTPFKTQSVSNDLGSIITNNFEYRDVGTSLQVTPHITNGDIVSLDIIEEVSSLGSTPATTGNSNTVIGPTTNKNSTRTSLLVPDGYFVIMSGMMSNEVDETRSQIPCIGSIPLVGAAFSDTQPALHKRNLMIFIRPQIIDTDEQILNITRHQQDVWKVKNELKPKWEVETETALDWFNVRSTFNTDDEDDLPCREWVH